MKISKDEPRSAGHLLQQLVNRISHRQGTTLAILSEAQISLQHVILLTRLREDGAHSVSVLAGQLNLSRPAASQAIDRLVDLGLIRRAEDASDRRRKIVSLEQAGSRLLDRLIEARTAEYARALSCVPAALQDRLAAAVSDVLAALRPDDSP